MREERPAVHRVDAHRNADEPGGEPTDAPALALFACTMCGRLLLMRLGLHKRHCVVPWTDASLHVPQLDEVSSRVACGIGQWACAMSGDGDIERVDQRGEERRHVCLRTTRLGLRDKDQELALDVKPRPATLRRTRSDRFSRRAARTTLTHLHGEVSPRR